MPLSLVSGDAWEHSRKLLYRNYCDLILVSIAGAEDADLSFSADTGMGECLVVARKDKTEAKRGTFVILNERPRFPLVGASAATQIRRLVQRGQVRRLEDGPVGGTPISFGGDLIGNVISAPLPAQGGWNVARIADLSLAQAAWQLAEGGRVWLPTMPETEAVNVPITRMGQIASIGPYHADINWTNANGTIRGPFELIPAAPSSAPTYPVLWEVDAQRQRTLMFEAERQGLVKRGKDANEQIIVDRKAEAIWATASHAHFNRDFRFNSQPIGMQYTPHLTIGGRAWLSLKLKSQVQEKAIVAWSNTVLGCLLYWWYANKQQSGRGSIGKSALENFPTCNVTSLSETQITAAATVFDKLAIRPFLPLHQIDKDPHRWELDELFGQAVLGLPANLFAPGGPIELLRLKIAREPSVRGSK